MPTTTHLIDIEESILALIQKDPMRPADIASALKREGIDDEAAEYAIRALIERRRAVPNVEWRLTATRVDRS